MQHLRGDGVLYDSRGNRLSEVDYEIFRNGAGEAEWWGEITPHEGIMPSGNCVLELETGRRGPCTVRMRTNSSFGLVVDSFDVRGNGPFR